MPRKPFFIPFLYCILLICGSALASTRGGHSFLGLIMVGICCIRGFYFLLSKNSDRHPKISILLKRVFSYILCLLLLAAIVTGSLIGIACNGDPHRKLDYVILLGAGVNGTEPSLSLKDRLDTAVIYLTEHPETICIVTGGKGGGENISEAECMFRYLKENSIQEDRIWQEDQATTTAENIRYSLSLIKENTGKYPSEIGIISSEYHLYRAKMFTRPYCIPVFGIPANSSIPTVKLNYFLREIIAVWYYSIIGG